ncbi:MULTISPECIES: ABC transporter permease [Acetoanaerobium]|jgi:tungstate transport system permease protein|uniref:ABC transporter permease n=1 Tax=Acetoanaerobium TaxID=186831 RepID=UPI001B470A08|nr:ABC transporter permease [Acetoanaerobium sp.]MBP9499989.1 ABC transporter permease [Acetoanaerobium sp.]MBP9562197.1 ABC transporter permease [Acetoanaerobium sp.]MDK2803807.1 tungstate transport system permease protein [Peptostreptococcaceae bacterium]
MDLIIEGLKKAIHMILTGDPEVLRITLLTLQVSGTATLISLIIGIPFGTVLALKRFPGRDFLMSIVNTGMGMPPVVAGLWISILLWRSGPLGSLNLIYTPTAIIIAQAVIASPIVVGLTSAAISQVDPKLRLQIKALGATKLQYLWFLLKEARFSLLAAVIAGFGAVVSEVGASMMVGGNVKGLSRVLTTATVMEVSKGNFDVAIALSAILVLVSYLTTLWLTVLQQKR